MGIARAIFARHTHERMKRQHVKPDEENAVSGFCITFQGVIDGLIITKREHRQYDLMKQRKFLLLCYLHSIEIKRARFTISDIAHFFRSSTTEYSAKYWSLLVSEGWVNEVEFKTDKRLYRKPRKLVKRSGVVSPLFASLLRLVWGARLRRVVGYPNASANKLKQHGKTARETKITSVPGCKPVEKTAPKTALDSLFQDIKDERI